MKWGRDEVAEKLADGLEAVNLESGGGIWKWDVDRYRRILDGERERERERMRAGGSGMNGLKSSLMMRRDSGFLVEGVSV